MVDGAHAAPGSHKKKQDTTWFISRCSIASAADLPATGGVSMRFRDDESGQMLVLTALCMTLLMGFLALAIDVGILFRAKRNVQIAADAGAIAGALHQQYGGSPGPACGGGVTGVRCAVQNAVGANGIPASDVASVSTSPTAGYHTGPG